MTRALLRACTMTACALALASDVAATTTTTTKRVLRVCADPDNMPFSNAAGDGIENKLARIIAEELDADVETTWWAQRRGFFRNTLNAKRCDVVMGVPAGFELAATTAPYYRSSYVFLARAGTPAAQVRSLDDPALQLLRIGVHLVGDDGANTPPAHALARRGLVDNVRGYPLVGDERTHNPSALVAALERGEIDVAIAWGPLAGWHAKRARPAAAAATRATGDGFPRVGPALVVTPVRPKRDGPYPFEFAIAVGVRKGDTALRDEIDAALKKRKRDVDALLDEMGVPRP